MRKDSFNGLLAQTAEKMIGDLATVTFLDYTDVPMINQDTEYPAPAEVTQLRQTVAEADGLWIFTPEYNGSYPGILKNMIDWLSRPVTPNDYATPTVINGKKVTISGAGGNAATSAVREKLCDLLTMIHADVMPDYQTGVVLNMEAWTENRMVLTDEQNANLDKQAKAFVDYIQ